MRNEGIARGDDFFIATVGRLESLKSSKQMERAFFACQKARKCVALL